MKLIGSEHRGILGDVLKEGRIICVNINGVIILHVYSIYSEQRLQFRL